MAAQAAAFASQPGRTGEGVGYTLRHLMEAVGPCLATGSTRSRTTRRERRVWGWLRWPLAHNRLAIADRDSRAAIDNRTRRHTAVGVVCRLHPPAREAAAVRALSDYFTLDDHASGDIRATYCSTGSF